MKCIYYYKASPEPAITALTVSSMAIASNPPLGGLLHHDVCFGLRFLCGTCISFIG